MAIVSGNLEGMAPVTAPVAPLAPVEPQPTDIPPELRNNPMYMTPMRSPSGKVEDVAPNELDEALALGYGTLNPDRLWEMKKPFQEPINVAGRDLAGMAAKGYRTNKLEEFEAQMQELGIATAPKLPEYNMAEKIFGGYIPTFASAVTLSASDWITRGINELEGASMGDSNYAKRNADELRSIRDSLGAGGVVAEIVGAILPAIFTGGASLSLLGKSAIQRVGLAALEGTAYGLASESSRQALGDPKVTAESYLWSAGLGAVLGGSTQTLSNVLLKNVAGRSGKAVGDMEINLGDTITDFADSRVARTATLPIRSEGKLLGTVELSRGLDSAYHPGSKQGIVIESLNLADDAPMETKANLLHSLVGEFGSVASPSTVGKLDEIGDMFSKYGLPQTTQDGQKWYQITAGTLPDKVGQQSLVTTLGKLYYKIVGKYPSKSEREPFEAMERLFDPDQGLLNKNLLEYAADKDARIFTVVNSFKEADQHIKTYVKAANAAQDELGSRITAEGAVAMKKSLNDVQRGILDSITELDAIPSRASSSVTKNLVAAYDSIEKVITAGDPKEAWKYLKYLRDDFKSEMASVLPSATKKMKGEFPEEVASIYKKTFKGIDNSLKNKAALGEDSVNLLMKLDDYADKLKATAKEFDSNFKSNIGGKVDFSIDKIQNTFDSTKPGRQLHRADVIDRFKTEAQGFMDTVKEAKAAGLAKDVNVPDPRLLTPMFSEIGKARAMSENMRIIQTMKAGTGISNFLTSAVATAAPYIGVSTGNPLIGIMAGQIAGAGNRTIGDPMAVLKLANTLRGVETQFTRIADTMIHAGTKAMPIVSRGAIIATLGIKRPRDEKNPTEYINNTRDRLIALANPSMVAETVQGLPQEAQQPVAESLQRNLNYAISQTPVVKPGRQMSHAEALKLDKVLLALTNPKAALHRAVVGNDADALKHLQAMYPLLVEKFQTVLSERMEDNPKLSYNQKITLQRIVGLNSTRTSIGATKLAQGVFAGMAAEGSAKGITGAPATTGTEIQDV